MQSLDNYEKALLNLAETRRKLKTALKEIADEVTKHTQNSKIVNVTAAPLGIVGSSLMVGGFVTGFFTFGVGFSLCIAGAAISGSSAVLGVSGKLTEVISKKVAESAAKKFLEEHERAQIKCELTWQCVKNTCASLSGVKNLAFAADKVMGIVQTSQTLSGVTGAVAKASFDSMSQGGKVMASIGVGFAIISIPLDIRNIVLNTKAICSKDVPEIAKKLQEFADNLTVETDEEIREEIEDLRKVLRECGDLEKVEIAE